jgi:hypothetical protein
MLRGSASRNLPRGITTHGRYGDTITMRSVGEAAVCQVPEEWVGYGSVFAVEGGSYKGRKWPPPSRKWQHNEYECVDLQQASDARFVFGCARSYGRALGRRRGVVWSLVCVVALGVYLYDLGFSVCGPCACCGSSTLSV